MFKTGGQWRGCCGFGDGFSALLLVSLVVVFCVLRVEASQDDLAENAGQTFYVDSMAGLDENTGNSPELAWKSLDRVNQQVFRPGDSILFKAGGKWTGQLRLRGSGLPNRPICVDRYDSGNLPLISQGSMSGAVVELKDQEGWEICNVEICGGSPKPDERVAGIRVVAEDAGHILKHIVIRNCVIRDILGSVKQYNSCAIWVGVPGWNNNKGLSTGFDGILIENNKIHNADRCGILVWTPSAPGGQAGEHAPFQDGLIPSQHVVVRGNELEEIGGDGILVLGSEAPLIEWNTVRRSSTKCGDPAYGVPGNGYNPCSAAIWLHSTRSGTIQHNAVYDTAKHKHNNDGMAFDFDFNCVGNLVQYNYSCNNSGGFLLIMKTARENIARYNVSENDRDHVLFLTGRLGEDNLVHNNTFYLDSGNAHLIPRAKVWNNIFVAAHDATYRVEDPAEGDFKHNCYHGNWENLPDDSGQVTGNPLFMAAGGGGNGAHLSSYRLCSGSPCRAAGILIDNNGGRDITGTLLPAGAPDIGALQTVPLP